MEDNISTLQELFTDNEPLDPNPHALRLLSCYIRGMLKKAASGVLALLPCSRTERTLRASKGLRPCWIDPSERLRACFFEHSLPLMQAGLPGTSMGHGPEIFNRPLFYKDRKLIPNS